MSIATTKPSVIFFGTGAISLRALQTTAKLCRIEAVITKADSSNHGRVTSSPVKIWANQHNIAVFQPGNKRELSQIFAQESFQSRMGVLVDYGLIIEQSVIDFFARGIVNSHFSLLPKLRGADPITSAILQGLPQTGVSLMLLTAGLDTGPIIAQEATESITGLNIHQLEALLMDLNDKMLQKYLVDYCNGKLTPVAQDEARATMTRQLKKSDGQITADKSAQQVEREIRAYLGWPGSFFVHHNLRITITVAKIHQTTAKLTPLELAHTGAKLLLGCGDGAIEIDRLKIAGKNEMSAQAFINGYKSTINTI